MKYVNSPFQWVGGKSRALPHVLPILNNFKKSILVEPFIGAANISLNYDSEGYIWNDYNKDLIDSYNVMFKEPEKYIEISKRLFEFGFDSYEAIRDKFNSGKFNEVERAAIFQYLNKHGFNGLCRYNKNGLFNVSKGTVTKNPKVVPSDSIIALSEKHRDNTELHNKNFSEIFELIKGRDDCLVYSDPPYVPLTSNFKYTKDGFNLEQQEELKKLSKECNSVAMISNHWTPYTENLYSDADEIHLFDLQRTVSSDGSNRKKVQECLVVYY
ncbi:DNA adenine methylase [Aeromonas phage ZPAH1]|nr:DNA adenine methylase [Aeromonas phage ZPAH1]